MNNTNKVTLTMVYEGQEITRVYDFSKIENIDWNEKVDDMYETLLDGAEQELTSQAEDRYDAEGMPSYE